MTRRDEFRKPVVEALAKRVGYHCSNPKCRKLTSGPHTDADGTMNIGVAAHITAAASGGPRYDTLMTPAQRRAITNGIWLCQACAKMIDDDELKYTTTILLQWKKDAEEAARENIESSIGARAPSDFQAVEKYRAFFDRPALQDALWSCANLPAFSKALTDLISLLNTGIIDGKPITKSRHDIANTDWKAKLECVYHKIRKLREMYVSGVKSGDINENSCLCGFQKETPAFENLKREIIEHMNVLLSEANLSPIRNGR